MRALFSGFLVAAWALGTASLACADPLAVRLPEAAQQSTTPSSIPWGNNRQPCWDEAGARHGVDPWLLYAIASVESRHNPSAVNRSNSNGTVDMGIMQINSVHLPRLRRYGVPERALWNACASAYIGAWILAENFRRFGYSWEAIAAYNVGSLNTPARRRIGYSYAKKVYAAYGQLVQQHVVQPRLGVAPLNPEASVSP